MGEYFDTAVAWLVGAALVIVGCGCAFGADWIVPSPEGTGPYRTAGREHSFHVILIVAAVVIVVCLIRAALSWSGVPMFAAIMVGAIVALFALPLYRHQPEVELRSDGFAGDWYTTSTSSDLMFHNISGADITVCLGIGGDCDSTAAGPARLRSPGLVVAPDHRVSVATPRKAGDFRLTLAGTGGGFTRRDATLHTYVPDSGGGGP